MLMIAMQGYKIDPTGARNRRNATRFPFHDPKNKKGGRYISLQIQ